MATVYVFLAEGFEEVEALTPVDVLRRAGIPVCTVGLGGRMVKGGHGICVQADVDGADFTLPEDAAMVLLPGGGLGTQNLAASPVVAEALRRAAERDIFIAAICAAPTVLHAAGLLAGKRATAYPTEQAALAGAQVTGRAVEADGKIITGRAMGVALGFSHALVAALAGKEKADEVIDAVYP